MEIYAATNRKSNKSYIGYTKYTLNERRDQHYRDARGGEGGGGPTSEATKRLISKTLTGSKQTQKHINNKAASHKGTAHGPHTEATKAKISASKKGVAWTEARWEAHRQRQIT